MPPSPTTTTAKPSPPSPTTKSDDTSTFNRTTDICQQLLTRYSTSSAPHHRHLIATAAAIRSLLIDVSLPLTPFSYFAASITSLSDSSDSDSVPSLATFLSIVVKLIGEGEIGTEKAGEAVEVLVGIVEREGNGEGKGVKCLVKCLGDLLGFCDLRDWVKVKVVVGTLIRFSVDKRPKVRRCALLCLMKCLKLLRCPSVKKKASRMVLSLLSNYMVYATNLRSDGSSGDRLLDSEQSEFVHALNVVKLSIPYLSSKISVGIVSELLKLLGLCSVLAIPILDTIQTFLGSSEVEVTSQVAEDIVVVVLPFMSEKNTADTVISSAQLLNSALCLLETSKWSEHHHLEAITPVAGLLILEDDTASKASLILKDIIRNLVERFRSHSHGTQQINYEIVKEMESNAVTSICDVFETLLQSCSGVPNVHVLDVLSALFINLGDTLFSCTKKILIRLAEFMVDADNKKLDTVHLEKCVGSAVIAMGPENILSILPISFDEENFTCSNLWLLPILKKYTLGASLQFFMERIVPLSESLQRASTEVKKSIIAQELQAHARCLWGLLPAICRHTVDIAAKFDSLAKLFITRLQKDPSTHEDISIALQELVRQNKFVLQFNDASGELAKHIENFSLADSCLVKRNLLPHSKKIAARNLKEMAYCSGALLPVLSSKFFSSTPQKRAYLKEAIQCMASISDSSVTKKIITSSLKRFKLEFGLGEFGHPDSTDATFNEESCYTSTSDNSIKWCLILELASVMVDGANEDLLSLMFKLAKHALKAGESRSLSQAYFTMSRILEEHPSSLSSRYDELVDLLVDLKAPTDVTSLKNRLVCLKILLVHGLKNKSGVENTKAFAVINEVILALKNPEEDSRKEAYDVLLQIGASLHDPSSDKPGEPYFKLISMMVGYLSTSSPQIMSGVVSALSLLVYKEPDLCLLVPELVPSMIALLQSKAVEVIKAVLGFVKVLVSSLQVRHLQKFLPSIVDGVIPWSSVSKHHFRSKVIVILEFLIRKCGLSTVEKVIPDKQKPILKIVTQNSHGKTNPKDANSVEGDAQPGDSSGKRQKKRGRGSSMTGNGSTLHGNKRNDHRGKKGHLSARGRGNHNGGEVGNEAKPSNTRKPFSPGKSNKRKRGGSQPADSRCGNPGKGIHKPTEVAPRHGTMKRQGNFKTPGKRKSRRMS